MPKLTLTSHSLTTGQTWLTLTSSLRHCYSYKSFPEYKTETQLRYACLPWTVWKLAWQETIESECSKNRVFSGRREWQQQTKAEHIITRLWFYDRLCLTYASLSQELGILSLGWVTGQQPKAHCMKGNPIKIKANMCERDRKQELGTWNGDLLSVL